MSSRMDKLLSLFEEKDYYSVSELARKLSLSEMTIRRYLNDLADRKLINRTHGGAARIKTLNYEPVFKEREEFAPREKREIARAAASLVQDGQIIAIDTGTTCSFIPQFLSDKKITVVTNSLRVMSECVAKENIKLLIPPGIMRSHEGSIYGTETVDYLSRFHFDVFFMGVGGIDENAGLTDYSLEDVSVKQTLIRNSLTLVTLADSSKINRITFAKISNLDEMDILITNRKLSAAMNDCLDKADVRVILAAMEEENEFGVVEENIRHL